MEEVGFALHVLAFALVAGVGAWLEWHSRKDYAETAARLSRCEGALDRCNSAILMQQNQLDELGKQCAEAYGEAQKRQRWRLR